jgi:DNA-binding LacI/PurR family transcriptional regulator
VTKPNLSSVDHQVVKSMEVAVTAILGQIGRPSSDETTAQLIAPKFVVRGSTGPALRA